MKRLNFINIFLLATVTLMFTSCLKDDDITLEGSYVEWDAAVYNANAGGRTYPILQRIPRGGEPVNNADPVINSEAGTVKLRINLVGAHRSSPTEFTFVTVDGETLPSGHVQAVAGTHYTTTGKVVVPANSSFGEAEIVLNPASEAGNAAFLVLEIQGSGDIAPMEREKRVALSIPQVAP